nr:hypothetical protein [Acinetobacter oleivorans]
MKDNLIVIFCGIALGVFGLKALFYFGRIIFCGVLYSVHRIKQKRKFSPKQKKMNDLAFRRLEQNLEKTGQS